MPETFLILMKLSYFSNVYRTRRLLLKMKNVMEENSKEKLTILLAVNMNGSEKIKPLVIGKAMKPR